MRNSARFLKRKRKGVRAPMLVSVSPRCQKGVEVFFLNGADLTIDTKQSKLYQPAGAFRLAGRKPDPSRRPRERLTPWDAMDTVGSS